MDADERRRIDLCLHHPVQLHDECATELAQKVYRRNATVEYESLILNRDYLERHGRQRLFSRLPGLADHGARRVNFDQGVRGFRAVELSVAHERYLPKRRGGCYGDTDERD